jgi:aminopeptidase N
VQHYDVTLAYDPTSDVLNGTVALDIAFTEARDAFTLDATPAVKVSRVTIDGADAKFSAHANELSITPDMPIEEGARHTVAVTYRSDPKDRTSAAGLPSGWFDVKDAGSYVLNEPDAARTWLPSNDHPSDKATWTFHLTVPVGLTAVANGRIVSHTTGAAGETWTWAEDRPMATYLVQLITGKYTLIEGTGPNGLPMLSAVLTADRQRMQPYVDAQTKMIDYFDDWFGPFPLDRYGIAMTDSFSGLAMEDQERPLFSRDDFQSGQVGEIEQLLLSHELVHQWFGDAVTPEQWDDIWLNESFATYGQWMWLDHAGVAPLATQAEAALGYQRANPTGKPTVDNMFGFESYDGGAVVLHALRGTIGDAAFFQLLKGWSHDNNGTSRSTADFIAMAEKVSGRDLTEFFDTWLFSTNVPTTYPAA